MDAITVDNLAAQRETAEQSASPYSAFLGGRAMRESTEEWVAALSAVSVPRYVEDWRHTAPERVRVLAAWCSLLPALSMVPAISEPDRAEWDWCEVRIILSSGGYEAWAELAPLLHAKYPTCPFMADETYSTWRKALDAAHEHSGLPINLGWIPFPVLRMPECGPDAVPTWLTALSALHVLKHTRSVPGRVFVFHRGVAASHDVPTIASDFSGNPTTRAWVTTALGGRNGDKRKKVVAPESEALTRALNKLGPSRLLPLSPVSHLPGCILAGAFSRLIPSAEKGTWFQHGLELHDVWMARDEKVRPFTGDDETILGTEWSVTAMDEAQIEELARLRDSMPSTYQSESPTIVFMQYQPNLVTDWGGEDALISLYDAVLVASVMRREVRGLAAEFPPLWVLPDKPTVEESTNQGKSYAVRALAGALVPGIRMTGASDSTSAPDVRAVASAIRRDGTVALDEWRPVRSANHPLAYAHFQSLATGGDMSLGEVLENNPAPVRLRQPVVINAKCMSLPDDMVNRSLFMYLRELTQDEQSRIGNVAAIQRGEVSLRMRLGALGLVEQFNLTEIEPLGDKCWRFPFHLALAVQLHHLRTGKPRAESLAEVSAALRKMGNHFVNHVRKADESGLLNQMEDGRTVSIRLSTLFGGLVHDEVTKMNDWAKFAAADGMTAAQLLRARTYTCEHAGSIQNVLRDLMGQAPKVSERALAVSLMRDVRRNLPKIGDVWGMPEMLGVMGWCLRRVDDYNNTPRVKMIPPTGG
jgi:hypothetical protein